MTFCTSSNQLYGFIGLHYEHKALLEISSNSIFTKMTEHGQMIHVFAIYTGAVV